MIFFQYNQKTYSCILKRVRLPIMIYNLTFVNNLIGDSYRKTMTKLISLHCICMIPWIIKRFLIGLARNSCFRRLGDLA